MIGSQVEREGIIRHGAKMITAVSEATVPKVSVIVRKAYGAGLYAMCGPAFEPDACLALPSAKIAVMGPEAAVNAVFYNRIQAIGQARVGDVGGLGRAAGAAAVAAIGHHVDAPALGHEPLDARRAVGQAAGVAVEIEEGRLARPGLAVPGDDARAVGGLEHALLDAGKAHLRPAACARDPGNT